MTKDIFLKLYITFSWRRSKIRGWPNCAAGGWHNSIHSCTQRYIFLSSYCFVKKINEIISNYLKVAFGEEVFEEKNGSKEIITY